MNKAIKYLTILCLVQAALASAVWLRGNSTGSQKSSASLFSETAISATDKLEISDKESKTILQKQDNGEWVITNYNNQPAREDKVENLLKSLESLNASWPVATTEDAAERFEVSNSNSQKILSLYAKGENQATLRLGTSPSYKKLHARLNDNHDIFTVSLGQYDVPADPASWFDNTQLQLKLEPTSVAITLNQTEKIQLNQLDSIWTLDIDGAGKSANMDKTTQWINNFKNLRLKSLADTNQVEKITVQDPVLTASFRNGEKATDYSLYKFEDKNYVKRHGDKHLFELSSFEGDPIINITKESFLERQETQNK